MDITAEIVKEEGWARTIQVTVPAVEVDKATDDAVAKYAKKAELPGFRAGKAPKSLIKERFGGEIHQETLESLLPRAYGEALEKLKLQPLGSPHLSEVKFNPGDDLVFNAELEIRPQVDITGYRGLKLERKVYEITERDVDMSIDSLRDNAATTVEVQRAAQKDDVVVCDLQKISDKNNRVKQTKFENVTLELREDRGRAEFVKGIVGMVIGEGREIEVSYPPEERDPDLAGNTVLFRAWLKSVSEKKLPEANDEFAKSMGNFESLADLRKRIEKDLNRRAESAALKEMGNSVRKLIVEANAFDVPKGLLEEYFEGVSGRLRESNPEVTPEMVRKQFEPSAVEQFRWDYIVFEIAQKEGLAVTDEDVTAVLKTWPEDSPDRPTEGRIRESLMENKVIELVVSEAEVTNAPRVLNPQIVTPSGGA
jgi:trigger factor